MRAIAILAAAGSGQRLGAGRPKALVDLCGRPLLAWAARALAASDPVEAVVVAAPAEAAAEALEAARAAVGGLARVDAVEGGATRSESVAAALALAPPEAEAVVVHDAARPLVTPGLVEEAVEALAADPARLGVVVAAPVTETVKEVMRGMAVARTLDRSRLWAAQTPQVFRAGALREAISSERDLLSQATDDAMLVERLGRGEVVVHESRIENLKVTRPLDLEVAELVLRHRGVLEDS